jgi:hypothetical protein
MSTEPVRSAARPLVKVLSIHPKSSAGATSFFKGLAEDHIFAYLAKLGVPDEQEHRWATRHDRLVPSRGLLRRWWPPGRLYDIE